MRDFLNKALSLFNAHDRKVQIFLVVLTLISTVALILSRNSLSKKVDMLMDKLFFTKNDTYQQTLQAIDPLTMLLKDFQMKIKNMDQQRQGETAEIVYSIKNITNLQQEIERLRNQIHKMSNIFNKPQSAGKWGEVQLKRIAELSGMLPFCDIETQYSIQGEEGKTGKRPDMIVRLPNGGVVCIDSKCPTSSINFDDEKEDYNPAKVIRNHIIQLGNKKYWEICFKCKADRNTCKCETVSSPNLTIMFIPIEAIWIRAIEMDSSILDLAASNNIVVGTPMTVLTILKIIYFAWEQLHFSTESKQIKKTMENYIYGLEKTVEELSSITKQQNAFVNKVNSIINKLIEEQRVIKDLIQPKDLQDKKDNEI